MSPLFFRQKSGAFLNRMRISPLVWSQRGFTLLELLIVLGIAIILIGLFLPAIPSSKRRGGSRVNCASSLKQVGLAFRVWANDHSDRFPMSVSVANAGSMEYVETEKVYRHYQVMSNELIATKLLICSTDRERTRASDFNSFGNTNLSYFVGVDADERRPNMILSGDRNVTGGASANGHLFVFTPQSTAGWSKAMHNSAGNVGLADGSVQQVTAAALDRQFKLNTNEIVRLAIP